MRVRYNVYLGGELMFEVGVVPGSAKQFCQDILLALGLSDLYVGCTMTWLMPGSKLQRNKKLGQLTCADGKPLPMYWINRSSEPFEACDMYVFLFADPDQPDVLCKRQYDE